MVRVIPDRVGASRVSVLTTHTGYRDGKYYLPNDEVTQALKRLRCSMEGF